MTRRPTAFDLSADDVGLVRPGEAPPLTLTESPTLTLGVASGVPTTPEVPLELLPPVPPAPPLPAVPAVALPPLPP